MQYWLSAITKKKKKEVLRHRACNAQRARDDSSVDGASTRALRVCIHARIVYTCIYVHDRCLEIYITPQRHCRTEKRVAGARSIDVSLGISNINSITKIARENYSNEAYKGASIDR